MTTIRKPRKPSSLEGMTLGEIIRQSDIYEGYVKYQNIMNIENEKDRNKLLDIYYAEPDPSDIEDEKQTNER